MSEQLEGLAKIQNVAAFAELVERCSGRRDSLPGMAVFHGVSGYGKTHSAIWSANMYSAYHVQVKSAWTRKSFCQALVRELGIPDRLHTLAEMVEAIGAELAHSRRPLLIDEADYLTKASMIEIVRDIYESSQSPVILIGEENLPHKLKAYERVHGRMLDWVAAQPASLKDTQLLAAIYCRGIDLAPDMVAEIHRRSEGSVRRICVNLDRVFEWCRTRHIKQLGVNDYKGALFTGQPQSQRAPALRMTSRGEVAA